jgi:hypothetical protein
MSAKGQKATLQGDLHMSALPQKLDIIDFKSTRPSHCALFVVIQRTEKTVTIR